MAYNRKRNDEIFSGFLSGGPEEDLYIQKLMDIAAQIDNYLKENGWTQKKLAENAGIRPSQLSEILAGEANPTVKTITKIEKALGEDIIVSPDFYEIDMEEKGWVHPDKITTIPSGSYRVELFDDCQILINQAADWQKPLHIKGKQYSSASEYHLKRTGTHG